MLSFFAVPKPRSMFYFVSLRTAAEFIQFTLLINKVTGFYGILAIFTGYHLNALQASHYVYSLVILGLAAWLSPSLRRPQDPLRNLALAWLYILDTVVNSVYTGLFGTGWFVLLSQHLNETAAGDGISVPGKGTMDETAGFTSPEFNATQVEVVANPSGGLMPGQHAVAYASNDGDIGKAVLQSDSLTSIVLISVFMLMRIYFCLIVLSYARRMLRLYIATTSAGATGFAQTEETDPTIAESPFRVGRIEGEGWKGKLGRLMLAFPSKRYWLGREEQQGQDNWERSTAGKIESSRRPLMVKVPAQREGGIPERERRARSGTGPPTPSTKVFEQ